jgi:hypothetical protein
MNSDRHTDVMFQRSLLPHLQGRWRHQFPPKQYVSTTHIISEHDSSLIVYIRSVAHFEKLLLL